MKVKDLDRELESSEQAVEALMPSTPTREITMSLCLMGQDGYLTDERREFTFTQATLGMGPIQDFFNKIGREIKAFVKGESGVKLGELFKDGVGSQISMPTEISGEAVQKVVDENQAIIMALLQLVEKVPELEWDIIALSFGVQRHKTAWFKQAITEPPHRGGLTIEQGFDILKIFIRQNVPAVRRFFEDQAATLVEEFQLAVETEEEDSDRSTGGTPSSTSAPATQESGSTTS